jgi:hypothetical protein
MKIQADAGLETIGRVAILPVFLAVVFVGLLVLRKQRKVTAG